MKSMGPIWKQVGQNLQETDILFLFAYVLCIIIGTSSLLNDGISFLLSPTILFSVFFGMEIGKHLTRAKIQIEKSV